MSPYHFQMVKPGLMAIEEEEITYHASVASLIEDIQHMNENRQAYVNKDYYEQTLKMLEEALEFIKKKEVQP